MKKEYDRVFISLILFKDDVLLSSGNENWVNENDLPEWWNG